MAQLLEAYSEPTPDEALPFQDTLPNGHYHYGRDAPPPPLLPNNDTTSELVAFVSTLDPAGILKTLALFVCFFLLVRQLWRWRAQVTAQRRRRSLVKTD